MKYFYLKDGDIFGPLEPKEIVAEAGTIADTLVCPEAHSADQDYWKDSSEYPSDFGPFLNDKEQGFAPHKEPAASFAADAQKAESKPAVSQTISSNPAEVLTKTKPAPLAASDTLGADHTTPAEDIVPPLTELINTPADTVADLEPQTDENEGTLFVPKAKFATAKPIVVGQEQTKEEHPAPEHTPEPLTKTETVPSSVELLPIEQIAEPAVNVEHKPGESFKEEAQAEAEDDLPHGVEETFSTAKTVRILVDEMKEPPQIIDKAAPAEGVSAAVGGDKHKEKSFFSAMKEEQPAPGEQVDITETPDSAFPFADENSMVTDDDINTDPFLEIENKLINREEKEARTAGAQKDTKTSEKIFDSEVPTVNGKIISAYEAPGEPQKPRNDVLIILIAFMVFFVLVALFMTKLMDNGKDKKTPSDAAAEVTKTKVAESASLPIVPGEDSSAQPAAAPIPAALENRQGTLMEKANEDSKLKAQGIVKRYLLNEARGTIGEYFDKLYGADYQTRWSSNPLVSETYVVEFVASKVRKEPIVYLFRVDLKKGVVTGGLNNITLDLLQN